MHFLDLSFHSKIDLSDLNLMKSQWQSSLCPVRKQVKARVDLFSVNFTLPNIFRFVFKCIVQCTTRVSVV